jgi:hypothetical protein
VSLCFPWVAQNSLDHLTPNLHFRILKWRQLFFRTELIQNNLSQTQIMDLINSVIICVALLEPTFKTICRFLKYLQIYVNTSVYTKVKQITHYPSQWGGNGIHTYVYCVCMCLHIDIHTCMDKNNYLTILALLQFQSYVLVYNR